MRKLLFLAASIITLSLAGSSFAEHKPGHVRGKPPTEPPTEPPPEGETNSRISGNVAAGDRAPQMAWNSTTDEFLYVWDSAGADKQKCTPAGGNASYVGAIQAKIVAAADIGCTNPAGTVLTLAGNPDGTGTMQCPQVTYHPGDNSYFVAWTDWDGSLLNIHGRDVAADGTLGPTQPLVSDARFPFVNVNAVTGDYLMSYTLGQKGDPNFAEVCKSTSGAAGPWTCASDSLPPPDFVSSEVWTDQGVDYTALAVKDGAFGTGYYFLSFPTKSGGKSKNTKLMGVLLDTELNAIEGPTGSTGEFEVIAEGYRAPFVAYSQNGTSDNFLLVTTGPGGHKDGLVWGRLMTNDPSVCGLVGFCFDGPEFPISDAGVKADMQPGVSWRDQGYVVAWRNNGDNIQYATTVDFDAMLGVQGNSWTDAAADPIWGEGSRAGLATRGDGATVIAWTDGRDGDSEVYTDWFDGAPPVDLECPPGSP